MEDFFSYILELVKAAQPYVVVVVIASLFINGVALTIPSKKTKEFALSVLPWVCIGCAISLFAVSLGTDIAGKITF